MVRALLIIITTLFVFSCTHGATDPHLSGHNEAASKGDWGFYSDEDWANQFFLTQVHDPYWNAFGMETDTESSSCGPASLAMLMRLRGVAPDGLDAQMAIDHARALMHPAYPDIDPSSLPEGATLYVDDGVVFVEDNTRPVYFDLMEEDPSIPQGILNGGGSPVYGFSWDELENMLESHGAAIGFGHITEAWSQRFPGDYGDFVTGAVPHFIALFPGSWSDEFIVSDPMHRGGAVVMTRNELQTFFKSPINVFDTSIRLIAWETPWVWSD